MSKIICFGDSWAAGAELDLQKERPFIHWISDELKIPYVNCGKEGSSLGIILHTIITQFNNITSDDIVIIIVPPDTRWYDENQENGFYSIMNWQRDDYFKFLNQKTLEWFRYHHAMFIYTIQKIFDDIGCSYVMAHNYGQIDEYNKYHLKINFDHFLSDQSLTELLSPSAVKWKSYPDHLSADHRYDEDGPTEKAFVGPYFEGCKSHPNEHGHKYIAQLFLKKLKSLPDETD